MLGSNLLSLAFGMNLDAHSPSKSGDLSGVPSSPGQCLAGRACYIDSLYITIAACSLALLLSIWAGWKDHRKLWVTVISPVEVVWEEAED